MQIWRSLSDMRAALPADYRTVVTIGNFDGVHRGHQAILGCATALAGTLGLPAVGLTFSGHTETRFGNSPRLINSPALKHELLVRQGLDSLLELEFTAEFAALPAEIFYQEWLLKGMGIRGLVVGHDFRFGAGGRGDYQLLTELSAGNSIILEQIMPVMEGVEVVSSSRIRELITAGELEKANLMLGYPFTFKGKVVHGEKRGRTLGFPTANIIPAPEYLLPGYGVYFVRLKINTASYPGVASVGVKPTFGSYMPRIEVHLWDRCLDLYDQEVRVEFLRFIRSEMRFNSADELVVQMRRDVARAREDYGDFVPEV